MSYPLTGNVYFDQNFSFEDGKVGPKLFVIVGEHPKVPNSVLVVRVTSKPKSEPNEGCYPDELCPCFFIPKGTDGFKEDTWVQFDYFPTLRTDIFKRWDCKFCLSPALTIAILACATESPQISGYKRQGVLQAIDEVKTGYGL